MDSEGCISDAADIAAIDGVSALLADVSTLKAVQRRHQQQKAPSDVTGARTPAPSSHRPDTPDMGWRRYPGADVRLQREFAARVLKIALTRVGDAATAANKPWGVSVPATTSRDTL